ncbi:unnamed protein product [Caenorhabditis angaria]|uniref:Protein kinase domain-containing protein n=1 Tax=Caenorhabditis angaria TaxID=860376 RepID=A0A9P1IM81_9PELO|nr:unnamed protein product [Caenorhabditis angaria]
MSNRYETIRVAGRGAFGTVIVAKDSFTKRRVAIKRIIIQNVSKIQLSREISAIRCLAPHPNILKYIDCFAQSDLVSIVTEEVPYTLANIIDDKKRPRTEQFCRWFYSQILCGISHMHSKDIMHRDMKPENILVTSANIIKIADFGQACIYRKENLEEEYDVNVATRWYRAPEILFSYTKYTPLVDIWAIGCILAELFRGKPLFPGRSELEQISIIFGILGTPNETNWPNWKTMPDANKLLFEPKTARADWTDVLKMKELSTEFDNFLRLHLQLCSSFRPSANVLLNHCWIKNNDCERPNYRVPFRKMSEKKRELLPPLHVFL